MKILIVDDHPLVRKGLMAILTYEKEICSGLIEAENTRQALGMLRIEQPDVAIIDLRLGNEDGLQIIKEGKRVSPTTKFVVLTSSIAAEDFWRAKKMDIDGYIVKDAITEDLIYALRLVIRDKKYYDPTVIDYTYPEVNKNLDCLTARERDVLGEIAEGKSNNEIAKRLFISEYTVKKHVSNILGKLELNHRTEAALMASKMLQLNS